MADAARMRGNEKRRKGGGWTKNNKQTLPGLELITFMALYVHVALFKQKFSPC